MELDPPPPSPPTRTITAMFFVELFPFDILIVFTDILSFSPYKGGGRHIIFRRKAILVFIMFCISFFQ